MGGETAVEEIIRRRFPETFHQELSSWSNADFTVKPGEWQLRIFDSPERIRLKTTVKFNSSEWRFVIERKGKEIVNIDSFHQRGYVGEVEDGHKLVFPLYYPGPEDKEVELRVWVDKEGDVGIKVTGPELKMQSIGG